MSLEVAKVVAHVKDKTGDRYTNPEIATALALICGAICLGIGLLRLGFILEFIPGETLVHLNGSILSNHFLKLLLLLVL